MIVEFRETAIDKTKVKKRFNPEKSLNWEWFIEAYKKG